MGYYKIWHDEPSGEILFLRLESFKVIEEVYKERGRQEDLRKAGKFAWTCADPTQSNARKLAVLAEEFGEVAREVTEEIISGDKKDPDGRIPILKQNIRKELIQVAAVCVAWVEALDSETKP